MRKYIHKLFALSLLVWAVFAAFLLSASVYVLPYPYFVLLWVGFSLIYALTAYLRYSNSKDAKSSIRAILGGSLGRVMLLVLFFAVSVLCILAEMRLLFVFWFLGIYMLYMIFDIFVQLKESSKNK